MTAFYHRKYGEKWLEEMNRVRQHSRTTSQPVQRETGGTIPVPDLSEHNDEPGSTPTATPGTEP